jgi:putative isomerase
MSKLVFTIVFGFIGLFPAFTQVEQINIDISKTPFSMRGSYMAVKDRKEGLTIANLRAMSDIWGFIRIEFPDTLKNYKLIATANELVLERENSRIRVTFENPSVLRIRGENTGVMLISEKDVELLPISNNQWRMFQGWYERYLITGIQGNIKANYKQTNASLNRNPVYENVSYTLIPDVSSNCEFAVEIFKSEWVPKTYTLSFNQCSNSLQESYTNWSKAFPKMPEKYSPMAQISQYLLWANSVAPEGPLTRESIYMSKNWMCNIWSWDHCFNALALANYYPKLAWDQIMVVFDNQNELGALPDMINESRTTWGFLKVPVHGLIIREMMAKKGAVDKKKLQEIYEPLKKWTDFWFLYRDDDHDGIPQLNHSNEAADGATPFDVGLPIESPDLSAYLIIQMDVLADIANKLQKPSESSKWKERSEKLLKLMLDKQWNGEKFISYKSGTIEYNLKSKSYPQFIPLLLGQKLPKEIREKLVAQLKTSGMITPYGYASESTKSELFDQYSYWRGPVWAPYNYMIVEGLLACGENAMAKDLAEKFCNNVEKSGISEHFDPVTGEGIGDPGYSWTAAVYLEFVNRFFQVSETK